jgi:hypothetical protein
MNMNIVHSKTIVMLFLVAWCYCGRMGRHATASVSRSFPEPIASLNRGI